MKEKYIQGMTAREREYSNNKEAYSDRLKSTGRKVGFAVEFMDITKRRALLEETSVHTA